MIFVFLFCFSYYLARNVTRVCQEKEGDRERKREIVWFVFDLTRILH